MPPPIVQTSKPKQHAKRTVRREREEKEEIRMTLSRLMESFSLSLFLGWRELFLPMGNGENFVLPSFNLSS